MNFNAPHIGFIIAAYAISAVAIFTLCGFIFWRDHQLAKRLKQLSDQK